MIDFENLTPRQRETLEHLLNLDAKTVDRLAKVAESDERMEWLMATLRRVAQTVAIVLGAIILFWEQLKKAIQSIAGQ